MKFTQFDTSLVNKIKNKKKILVYCCYSPYPDIVLYVNQVTFYFHSMEFDINKPMEHLEYSPLT